MAPLPSAGVARSPQQAAPPRADTSPPRADVVPAGQAGGSARASGACEPMEGKFLLAFNKAEILDLLEQASRWTCRNFAYTEEVVRGKITLLSKTPVTSEEAYAAFLAALNTNGIAMYQTGKYWKLVRIADAKKVPIPTLLSDDGDIPAVEQPVTKLFRLRYVDPDQLRAVLGNFTSPQGADIQTIPPDILLVTDIGLNVRRIEKLLEALDRPGSHDLVRVIQVQYAPARDVADKVNQNLRPGARAAGQEHPPPGHRRRGRPRGGAGRGAGRRRGRVRGDLHQQGGGRRAHQQAHRHLRREELPAHRGAGPAARHAHRGRGLDPRHLPEERQRRGPVQHAAEPGQRLAPHRLLGRLGAPAVRHLRHGVAARRLRPALPAAARPSSSAGT